MHLVVLVAHLDRGHTLLEGLGLGGRTVLIRAADVDHVVATETAVPGEDISAEDAADDVAQMRNVIYIGQRAGDEDVALVIHRQDGVCALHAHTGEELLGQGVGRYLDFELLLLDDGLLLFLRLRLDLASECVLRVQRLELFLQRSDFLLAILEAVQHFIDLGLVGLGLLQLHEFLLKHGLSIFQHFKILRKLLLCLFALHFLFFAFD